MQPTRIIAARISLAILLLWSGRAAAQRDSHQTGAMGALQQWREAVLAGDQARLKRFYVSGPEAYVQTPTVKIADAATEEPEFWAGLHKLGLTSMSPKILALSTPKAGAVLLTLRIEMTFGKTDRVEKSVVAAAQTWVNQNGDWQILATQRSERVPLPVMRLPEPAIPNTHLYPDPNAAPNDLKAALTAAKMDHKRVLVVFGANWCYDCHVLDAALRSKELGPLVTSYYHVVHINIGDDGKSNSELADRFQVPLTKGIPSLAVLDGNQRLIASQKNGEFESAAKIGMEDVSGFLKRWRPVTAE